MYVEDKMGNRCDISHFGSREKARKALASLTSCTNCVNCHFCTNCTGCNACDNCNNCDGCFGCFDCVGCVNCLFCHTCNYCDDCGFCHLCMGLTDSYDGRKDFTFPEAIDSIHLKLYTLASEPNALDMRFYHICENTHCRAGWAVVLAGKRGEELASVTSTGFAAMQIYKASGYRISPVRFYESNEVALADMQACAHPELALPVSELALPVSELALPVSELALPVSELALPVSGDKNE